MSATINSADASKLAEVGNTIKGGWGKVFAVIAVAWSLFQIWIASPLPFFLRFGILHGVPARAIHLAFAFALVFMLFPLYRHKRKEKFVLWHDWLLAIIAAGSCLYIVMFYDKLVERVGVLFEWQVAGFSIPIEFIIGLGGLILLLEATRRAIGWPLVLISIAFIAYALFGQSMPDIIAHRGLSLERLVGYYWFGAEVVFGIPLDVATSFVFMFVLFGALLERAGGGKFFIDLAFAIVGRYRGGPAKASILASGMTGMISGSSIANTVTTGTFTIPVMRKVGLSAVKAGAIEVAASVNGQIMPPIMGAAAFIMAELLGISYREVIYHAFLPAVIAYLALFWISHLEAVKLRLTPMPASAIPQFIVVLRRGIHFLLPIAILIYLLLVKRFSPTAAIFWATSSLLVIMLAQKIIPVLTRQTTNITKEVFAALLLAIKDITAGLVAGARNMAGISIAVGCAGIIVGSVGATGLNNALIGIIEAIAGNNIYILLALTAILCLVLGLGLPTTANYLVVASLMAPVLVELGSAAGLVLPLIVVHLYVFYFGLMADVTPPVGLAAYAASAISRADPIKTGLQAFTYEIRTAILPLVFIFNTELVLIGIDNWAHGLFVFITSLLAILCFTTATQRFLFRRLHLIEAALLLLLTAALFRPDATLAIVYPRWQQVEISSSSDSTSLTSVENANKLRAKEVRISITRQTDYGDRYRMLAFPKNETSDMQGLEALELNLEATQLEERERAEVQSKAQDITQSTELSVLSLSQFAESKGLRIGDRITKVETKIEKRPSHYWVSALALLLLGSFCWYNASTSKSIRNNLRRADE